MAPKRTLAVELASLTEFPHLTVDSTATISGELLVSSTSSRIADEFPIVEYGELMQVVAARRNKIEINAKGLQG